MEGAFTEADALDEEFKTLLLLLLWHSLEELPLAAAAAAAANAAAFRIPATLLPLCVLSGFANVVIVVELPLKLLFVLLLIVLLMLLQLLFAVWLLLLLLLLLLVAADDDADDVEAFDVADEVIVDVPVNVVVVDVGDAEPLRDDEDFKSFCLFLFNNGGVVEQFVSESLSVGCCIVPPADDTMPYIVEFRDDDVVVDAVAVLLLWAGEEDA